MPKSNCLSGIRCPNCGHEDSFVIAVTGFVHVTDDGWSEIPQDADWNDSSFICCEACQSTGTVQAFTIPANA
jgi:hypothetical protein